MQINIPSPTSWRTSLGGVASLLVSLGAAAHLVHQGNYNFSGLEWAPVLLGVANGLAHLNARDNKVSSEQAGIKGPAPEKPTVTIEALKPDAK